MPSIKLTNGFSLIPEGTHIFKIVDATYKEEFGKIEIKMQTANGSTHIERFNLLKNNGDFNDGARNAFSYFARVALNDFDKQAVDLEELVGRFVECDVVHDTVPSTREPGKTVTFVRLADKRPSNGWNDIETSPLPSRAQSLNLDELLK